MSRFSNCIINVRFFEMICSMWIHLPPETWHEHKVLFALTFTCDKICHDLLPMKIQNCTSPAKTLNGIYIFISNKPNRVDNNLMHQNRFQCQIVHLDWGSHNNAVWTLHTHTVTHSLVYRCYIYNLSSLFSRPLMATGN